MTPAELDDLDARLDGLPAHLRIVYEDCINAIRALRADLAAKESELDAANGRAARMKDARDSWERVANNNVALTERAEADAAALRADIERHVALAATQANDIEALRALLRRWYEEYAGSTWPRGGPVDAQLDADTARALGEGR